MSTLHRSITGVHLCAFLLWLVPLLGWAQLNPQTATTSLTIGICGNAFVEGSEECDVPGETGVYSETIVGRQCTAQCTFGPYCGDGILQTQFGEECDDGANNDEGFCSSDCEVVPAGSGGGGSSGGGSSGGGGSQSDLGDTQVRITGRGYPNTTTNILLDTENVGTVRTNGDGNFEFLTDASPGTATLGVWANDEDGVRSITFNSTFDVTQAAITDVNNVLIPPTISVSSQNVDPGDPVTVSGYAIPSETVELSLGQSDEIIETTAAGSGAWEIVLDSESLAPAEYTLRARSVVGTPPLTNRSSFSTSLQLFVGVDGSPTTSSDLNRDGQVNLTDFSILIFWWQTDGGDSSPPADINSDGTVSLADFSILLFNWTG